jgi:glycosyltransferase involved in cell wall biosynthesis
MRILMIAPEPFFSPRGTPISIYHRLNAFSRLGMRVDLVTYHVGQDMDIPGVRIFRIPRLPLIRRVKVGPSYIKPLLDLFLFFKAAAMLHAGRYDVIHAHEEAAYFSIPLAALSGSRLLYDMHSSLPQQLANYGFTRSAVLTALLARLERAVIRRADGIITICPDLRRHVDRHGGGGKQFLIENTSVGEPLKNPGRQAADLRNRLGLGEKPLVVYTGTFEQNQGLELLIEGAPEVVAEFPEVVYLFVGGRSDQIERLRRLAAQRGIQKNILFPGTRPLDEIPVYLAAADVLVSPRSEGTNTPLKIYSYLAAGRAILATDLETHRQVLDEQTALMVLPTASGLAGGLRGLLRDRSRREMLARGARRRVREKYSYRSYLEKTREVLEFLDGR